MLILSMFGELSQEVEKVKENQSFLTLIGMNINLFYIHINMNDHKVAVTVMFNLSCTRLCI